MEGENMILDKRYQVEKQLGKGSFGIASLVKDLMCDDPEDPELRKVIKKVLVGRIHSDQTMKAIQEANLLSKLDHPSIVKFYDSFLDREFLCIVTEYCDGGDLEDKIQKYLSEGKTLDEIQVMDWFVQLLLGVQYMHSSRILHRDLKTRNNMVKIGDFGLSRILMDTLDMASTYVGTRYFMSPEVYNQEGYNSKSDIWSVGCILYRLCTLKYTYVEQTWKAYIQKIKRGNYLQLPDKYHKDLQEVLQLMLDVEPEKRASASELLKIPFVQRHKEKLENTKHKKDMQESENSKREAEEIDNLEAVGQSSEEAQTKKDQTKSSFLGTKARELLYERTSKVRKKRPQSAPVRGRAKIEENFDLEEVMLALNTQEATNSKQPHAVEDEVKGQAEDEDDLCLIVEGIETFLEPHSEDNEGKSDVGEALLKPRTRTTPPLPCIGISDQSAAGFTFYSQPKDFGVLEEVGEEIEGEAEGNSMTSGDDSVAGAFCPVEKS